MAGVVVGKATQSSTATQAAQSYYGTAKKPTIILSTPKTSFPGKEQTPQSSITITGSQYPGSPPYQATYEKKELIAAPVETKPAPVTVSVSQPYYMVGGEKVLASQATEAQKEQSIYEARYKLATGTTAPGATQKFDPSKPYGTVGSEGEYVKQNGVTYRVSQGQTITTMAIMPTEGATAALPGFGGYVPSKTQGTVPIPKQEGLTYLEYKQTEGQAGAYKYYAEELGKPTTERLTDIGTNPLRAIGVVGSLGLSEVGLMGVQAARAATGAQDKFVFQPSYEAKTPGKTTTYAYPQPTTEPGAMLFGEGATRGTVQTPRQAAQIEAASGEAAGGVIGSMVVTPLVVSALATPQVSLKYVADIKTATRAQPLTTVEGETAQTYVGGYARRGVLEVSKKFWITGRTLKESFIVGDLGAPPAITGVTASSATGGYGAVEKAVTPLGDIKTLTTGTKTAQMGSFVITPSEGSKIGGTLETAKLGTYPAESARAGQEIWGLRAFGISKDFPLGLKIETLARIAGKTSFVESGAGGSGVTLVTKGVQTQTMLSSMLPSLPEGLTGTSQLGVTSVGLAPLQALKTGQTTTATVKTASPSLTVAASTRTTQVMQLKPLLLTMPSTKTATVTPARLTGFGVTQSSAARLIQPQKVSTQTQSMLKLTEITTTPAKATITPVKTVTTQLTPLKITTTTPPPGIFVPPVPPPTIGWPTFPGIPSIGYTPSRKAPTVTMPKRRAKYAPSLTAIVKGISTRKKMKLEGWTGLEIRPIQLKPLRTKKGK
jgi:hypothetical protein